MTADEAARLAAKTVVRLGTIPEDRLVTALQRGDGLRRDLALAAVVVAKAKGWLEPNVLGLLAVGAAWWATYADVENDPNVALSLEQRMAMLAKALEDAGALERLEKLRLKDVARMTTFTDRFGKKGGDG